MEEDYGAKFDELVRSRLHDVCIEENEYRGFIEDEEKLNEFMFFLSASGQFFFRRNLSKRPDKETRHLYFHRKVGDGIPFFGPVFEVEDVIYYWCVHGKVRAGGKTEEASAAERARQIDGDGNKQRKLRGTKRIGCKAKMAIKYLRVYPAYTISGPEEHWRLRRKVMQQLKAALENNQKVESYQRLYVALSVPSEHTHPASIAMSEARLHPRLVNEVHNLVKANVLSVESIKFHLQLVVDSMFAHCDMKPNPKNACFFPSNRTISSHVRLASLKIKASKIDQEAMRSVIERWKSAPPQDHIVYRPYEDKAKGAAGLLFCYQTKWQQQLLVTYGGYVCVLDSTYKVDIPLFFILVKTNVNFCIVGSFVLQNESKETVENALRIFTMWNPEWKPKYFVTDASKSKGIAIENVFPETKICISPYHREAAWNKWLAKGGGLDPDSEVVVVEMCRTIAQSTTETEFQERCDFLFKHNSWKSSSRARDYFKLKWMPIAQRWVDALFDQEFRMIFKMNNGIEELNIILKHNFLDEHVDKSLTDILTVLVEHFIPDTMRDYSTRNVKISPDYRQWGANVPSFLEDRPYHFVRHVMDRLACAEAFRGEISHISEGMFCVQQDQGDSFYIVSFDPVKCSCEDFVTWMYPCVHFCAVFLFVSSWSFERLSRAYLESPFLQVNDDIRGSYYHRGRGFYDRIEMMDMDENHPQSDEEFITLDNADDRLKKEKHRFCNELRETMNLYYLCQDVNLITESRRTLKEINKKLRTTISKSANQGSRVEIPHREMVAAVPHKRKKCVQDGGDKRHAGNEG